MTADGRLRLLQVLSVALFALLAVQLIRLQVLDAAHYQAVASSQRLRILPQEAPRGLIYDRAGRLLVRNVPRFALTVVPGELPTDDAARGASLRAIVAAAELSLAEVERSLVTPLASVDPFAPVTVRTGLTAEQAIALRASLAGVAGARIETRPTRVYETGDLLPRIIGTVGPITEGEVERYLALGYQLDGRVGRGGVEETYEPVLRGEAGKRLVMADPAGRELEQIGAIEATPGADLVLAVDSALQRTATEALAAGIVAGVAARDPAFADEPLSPSGAAVVMDVRSGELLALVSLPAFSADVLAGSGDPAAIAALLTDPQRPLVHRAYMEVGAPGSIFKPIVGAAALEDGIATPDTRIFSGGAISVQDQYNPAVWYTFRDWMAHGTLDFYGGIARSSDVYFYYLAGGYERDGRTEFEGLGATRLAEYASAFGLGQVTGIDLPAEAGGLVPDPSWKTATTGDPWVLGDTYTFGIGQGYLTTTPLQMAVAVAAIANGGTVPVPRVVSAMRYADRTEQLPREAVHTVPVSQSNLRIVREAMRVAADPGGTALDGEPAAFAIGGKTGTAEFGAVAADGSFDTHGWYVGFGPYEAPEIVVVVYLEHGYGSTHAAPVARAIFEGYARGSAGGSAIAAASDVEPTPRGGTAP